MIRDETRHRRSPWTRRAVVKAGAALAGGSLVAAGSVTTLAAQEATPADVCPSTTEEENQAIVQRWLDILESGDVSAFPTVLSPDTVHHAPGWGDAQGIADVQASFARYLSAFPDSRHEILQWITDGEFVALHMVRHGTHQDEYAGIPATGREVSLNVISIFRIECGLIAEQWPEVDAIGLRQQLGAIPPPSQSAESTPVASATPAGTPIGDCPETSEEENAELVRRWYDEIWTQGNLDQLDQFVAGEHEHDRVLNRQSTGIEAREETIRGWRVAFPDLENVPELVLTDGDLVVARFRAVGTHQGPWQDIAPTGATVTWTGNTIYRIECGRIVEEWSEADGLAFFQQLGVVEWPPQATPAS